MLMILGHAEDQGEANGKYGINPSRHQTVDQNIYDHRSFLSSAAPARFIQWAST